MPWVFLEAIQVLLVLEPKLIFRVGHFLDFRRRNNTNNRVSGVRLIGFGFRTHTTTTRIASLTVIAPSQNYNGNADLGIVGLVGGGEVVSIL